MLQTHRWRSGSRWRTHGNSDTPRIALTANAGVRVRLTPGQITLLLL